MLPGSCSLARRKRSDPSQLLSLSRWHAQVRLVSEHDKKFCLLAVGSVLNHPRRDLDGLAGNMPARASRMLALPNARRT